MADPKTQFLTNDALTRKKWARDLFKVLLDDVEFNTLIGSGKDAVVMKDMDLAKGEGDQMTFGIRLAILANRAPTAIPENSAMPKNQ